MDLYRVVISSITTRVPQVNYRDGINDPLEMALLPYVDQVLYTIASPMENPGAEFRFEGTIRRTDQPDFKESFQGDIKLGTDGFSGSCVSDWGNDNETHIVESVLSSMYQGARISGRITPGQHEGWNEDLWMGVGFGSIAERGHVDGHTVEQSWAMDFNNPAMPTWIHRGNLDGAAFDRVMRFGGDGKFYIDGNFAGLRETGTAEVTVDGKYRITRNIGPYVIVEDFWMTNPGLPPPPPPPPEPPPPPPPPH